MPFNASFSQSSANFAIKSFRQGSSRTGPRLLGAIVTDAGSAQQGHFGAGSVGMASTRFFVVNILLSRRSCLYSLFHLRKVVSACKINKNIVSRDRFLPLSGSWSIPRSTRETSPGRCFPSCHSNKGRYLISFFHEGPTQVRPHKPVRACHEYSHGEIPLVRVRRTKFRLPQTAPQPFAISKLGSSLTRYWERLSVLRNHLPAQALTNIPYSSSALLSQHYGRQI